MEIGLWQQPFLCCSSRHERSNTQEEYLGGAEESVKRVQLHTQHEVDEYPGKPDGKSQRQVAHDRRKSSFTAAHTRAKEIEMVFVAVLACTACRCCIASFGQDSGIPPKAALR